MLVLVVALAAVAILGGLLAAFLKQTSGSSGQQAAAQPEAIGMGVPVRGMNRAQPGMRRRRRAAAARDSPEASEDEDDAPAEPEAPRFSKRDAYDARRAARDAEREAQEAAQEEEIRRAAEERRRREEGEAAKWMHMFTVEAAGEEALSKEEGQALEARFVEYIQQRKTVGLEELAAEFGMRSQEVIKRVQELEAGGAITGVMDDRGKFIYISREEMAAVADFIRQRGRIAIAELAAKSNQFVDLEAREVAGASSAAAELELDLAAGSQVQVAA